jgi:hypothetical protein
MEELENNVCSRLIEGADGQDEDTILRGKIAPRMCYIDPLISRKTARYTAKAPGRCC